MVENKNNINMDHNSIPSKKEEQAINDNDIIEDQKENSNTIFQSLESLHNNLSSIAAPLNGMNLASLTAPFEKIKIPPIAAPLENMNLSSLVAPLDGITQFVQNVSIGFNFQPSLLMENMRLLNESTSILFDSINSLSNICASFVKTIQAPSLAFLENFDTSYLHELLKKIAIGEDISHNYRDMLLQTMYEVKWFPSIVFSINLSILMKLNKIIHTSRGASKNREKRIDKEMFAYYTKTVVREIKKNWWNSDLDFHVRKMLGQTIEAYLRGEYALTICCLATMWEGFLKGKMPQKKRKTDELKKDIKELVVDNGYKEILGDFYNNYIIATCYGPEEVVPEIPNRHGIAHSWYLKYPSKKAALNAILLTDFIINLKPITNGGC